ncbi:MAG: hypothetical protein DMF62_12240 [Acidobacteria bacterium]|nr:MAG: hypothetical protein DMF62_12240 [Acidobacteriota bacterium]
MFLAAAAHGQEAESPSPPPQPIISAIFLAKADANGRAGEAAETFLVTDVPIFCVVKLYTPGVASVKMDFVAEKVPGVKPETKVVSTSYTTKENEDRVNFSGRPDGQWVAGEYRVDIFIGDKKVRNIEFVIKPSTAEAAKPSIGKPTRKPPKRSTSADHVAKTGYAGAFR